MVKCGNEISALLTTRPRGPLYGSDQFVYAMNSILVISEADRLFSNSDAQQARHIASLLVYAKDYEITHALYRYFFQQ